MVTIAAVVMSHVNEEMERRNVDHQSYVRRKVPASIMVLIRSMQLRSAVTPLCQKESNLTRENAVLIPRRSLVLLWFLLLRLLLQRPRHLRVDRVHDDDGQRIEALRDERARGDLLVLLHVV